MGGLGLWKTERRFCAGAHFQRNVLMEAERYRLAWRKRRVTQGIGCALILLWVPVGVLVAKLMDQIFGDGRYLSLYFFLYFSALIGIVCRLLTFKCPKCGDYFAITGMRGSLFTCRCLHCGVRAGTLPDDNASQ